METGIDHSQTPKKKNMHQNQTYAHCWWTPVPLYLPGQKVYPQKTFPSSPSSIKYIEDTLVSMKYPLSSVPHLSFSTSFPLREFIPFSISHRLTPSTTVLFYIKLSSFHPAGTFITLFTWSNGSSTPI